MIIAVAADEAFAPHAAVTLQSAWTHNRDARFVLLDCGIDVETLDRLRAFAIDLGFALRVMPVDASAFAPLVDNWAAAVFARLWLPDLIDSDERRVIYVDADAAVTGSLAPLWQLDLGNAPAAGLHDPRSVRHERKKGNDDVSPTYINTGVMVIDLDAWREQALVERALAYVRAHPVPYGDQTFLNALFHGQLKFLPAEWNLMPVLIGELDSLPPRPRVVHWAGPAKPWRYRDAMLAPIYWHHRRQTPFAFEPPVERYRSPIRNAANLAILRNKYLRQRAASRFYERSFVVPYLQQVAGHQATARSDEVDAAPRTNRA